MMKSLRTSLWIALALALGACAQPATEDSTVGNMAGLANPAAVYCEDLGFEMEAVQTDAGEDAVCIFPDGSQCGQWDFLAGRCGQEFSYCEQQGYDLVDVGTNIGNCVFPDGSSCGEYEFFQGECGPET